MESQVPAGYYVSTARADSTVVVTNTAKQPVSDKNNTQTQSNKRKKHLVAMREVLIRIILSLQHIIIRRILEN